MGIYRPYIPSPEPRYSRPAPPPRAALREVLERGRCQTCGNLAAEADMEVDHILPLADGGSNELDNLQLLCSSCHRAKTSRENSRRAKSKRIAARRVQPARRKPRPRFRRKYDRETGRFKTVRTGT